MNMSAIPASGRLPGSLAPFAVGLSGTVRDALAAIDRGARGLALLVDDGGRLLGTISDGDIRRAILAGATLDSPVAGIARRDFVSVPPGADRAHVLDLMRARSIQQVPILDGSGYVAGIHSLREIIGHVERKNWAVVMAGGRGERLRPLTDTLPKPMLRVAGRPILERLVLNLVGFGIRRIFLSVNYLADRIEEHFGDGSSFGCEISYLRESEPLGTGGGLSLLPERPALPVMVMNGDLITRFDVGAMLEAHERAGAAITVGVHGYSHTVPFGVVERVGERVVGFVEKPVQLWTTNAGIYVLGPDVVCRVPRATFINMTDLMQDAIVRGEAVAAFEIGEDWLDVGHPAELSKARGE
jgi:dTDP-glucose pyrophosphorylase